MSKLIDSIKNTKISNWHKAIIAIFVVLILITYENILTSPQFEKGNKQTQKLQKISWNEIYKIEMWQSRICEQKLIVPEINSDESRKLFASAMNDIEVAYIGHPEIAQKFYIVMYDGYGEKYEFDVYLEPYPNETAYMSLLDRPENDPKVYLRNLGSRKSKKLYKWLGYHGFIKSSNKAN